MINKTIRITNSMKILAVVIALGIAILSVYSFLKNKTFVQGANLYFNEEYTDKLIVTVSENQVISDYENVYNVSYLQKIIKPDEEYNLEATAIAKIRGEKVTFTNYYTGSTDYTTKNETTNQGNTCVENNIMAAIISGAGIEKTGFKAKNEEEYYYSGAQLAVWEFWNTWVENSGAKENGFEKGIGNETITENELNGEEQRKNAQQLSTQNLYNVNIYFLKYLTQNNSHILEQGSIIDNQPNLILIEILDEEEKIIEPEGEIIPNNNIYVLVSNNIKDMAKPGDEIIYNINVYNEAEEERQDLILSNKLPKGVTLMKVLEIINGEEIELNNNEDYKYKEERRRVIVNIDKIDAAKTGSMIIEETGETVEYIETGARKYKIIVKADEFEDGTYRKDIENVAEVYKGNSVLERVKTSNIISDTYLEIEREKLPEIINENEECIIGLRITNKGLNDVENVDVKISIPEEILIQKYKISILSETEEESSIEGWTSNQFEDNSIQVPSQKTVYIQIIGSMNEIEENKQLLVEGAVNGEKITWTTNVQKEGGY